MLVLPIPWPRPTLLRYGAPKMLSGVPIYYDFDWQQRFGHSRSIFPNCKSIARLVRSMTPQGKVPLLLLTDLEGLPLYRLDDTPDDYAIHIFNAPEVCAATADVGDTLLARSAAADADVLSALQRLRDNPVALRTFLHEELTPSLVLTWAGRSADRIAALFKGMAALALEPAGSANAALEVLSAFGAHADQLRQFAENAEQPNLRLASAALRYADQYLGAKAFAALVAQDLPEPKYQHFLEKHAWIFGTHYVGRWGGRHICVGDQQDFILETADGFYDVIELKRPSHEVLRWDQTHRDFYPAPELSRAIGQVQEYLKNIDQELPAIVLRHRIYPYRARGIIVIGRIPKNDSDQRLALRGLNSHLARIEILTYTDLEVMASLIVDQTRNLMDSIQTELSI